MILKGDKPTYNPLYIILLTGLVGLAFWGLKYFSKSEVLAVDPLAIHCDAESTSGGSFVTRRDTFNNGATQSSEESYTGTYSSKVQKGKQYGMSYRLRKPQNGVKYTARIWRKSDFPKNGKLVIKSPDNNYSAEGNEAIRYGRDGWEQVQTSFILPEDAAVDVLQVFPYIDRDDVVAYFDDLTISVENEDLAFDELEDHLHIYLDPKALDKINNKRSVALKKGLLQSSDDDWVKAKLTVDDSLDYDVKLRLKGDWTDHLKGDYWSYRIKMPSDKSWNRLMTFSLQDPKTRSYISEWLFHQVLSDEGIITPRYGFVKLSQNNQEPVLYAYEEHFEKQIAEYRDRREGVILKFSEDIFWEERYRNMDRNTINLYKGTIDHAEVEAFKQEKTLKVPKLTEQFEYGAALLKAYQEQSLPASEIFDIERMAKLYALCEVLESYHGLIWHNQRFYYNSVTRKLEPIGYDGYTQDGPYILYNKLFFGEYKTGPGVPAGYKIYQHLFSDPEFNRYYTKYLFEYTSKEFVSGIVDKYEDDINHYEYFIKKVDKSYSFHKPAILSRAELLRDNITPYDNHSLLAYSGMISGDRKQLNISNRHTLPLVIVGTGRSLDKIEYSDEERLVMSGPYKGPEVFEEITVPNGHRYIFYRLAGTDVIYHSKVKAYSQAVVPAVKYSPALDPIIPLDTAAYIIKDNIVKILPGNYSLSNPLIIPADHVLQIGPGTSINLTRQSYILSYGAVNLMGTTDSPISILSSDKTSQGFIVIGADDMSTINYTSFVDLDALEENEWQLTGAVTMYESDVKMDHVTISHNDCEDALNLVRSEFDIDYLNINNTLADGFDGDFCKGKITNSYFYKTGNDGLDYSGSFVTVRDVVLERIGDKGISAGEEASLTIKNVSVDGAEIGVASKDLSKVDIIGIELKNCNQGFAAYRKKPEFGGGSIKVSKYTAENVKKLLIADSESTIKLPD